MVWEIELICAPLRGDRLRCCSPEPDWARPQSLHSKNVDVISRLRGQRNDASHEALVRPHATRRVIMRHKLHLSAVIAMSLMTASSAAFAQAPGGGTGTGTGAAQSGASSGVGSAPPAAPT